MTASVVHAVATLALGPWLSVQGRRVRREVPRLPEPPGQREGTVGRGEPLRVLILGDSSAAGVGAAHVDEALSGRVVHALARHRRVHYRVLAKTGWTTASALDALAGLGPSRFDAAVTALGVNDVLARVTRREWRARQARLRESLRTAWGAARIVVSGLPPVHAFPALPQPLRWYLGSRARQFDRDLEVDVRRDGHARYLRLDFVGDAGLMASDGFHPGPGIYAPWGERVAQLILSTS